MPKPKSDVPDQLSEVALLDDAIAELEELDFWDMSDPADQAFWDEFFKVEDILEMNDDFDSPTFTISIQNHDTGELRTYNGVKLKPSRQKISC